MEGLSYMLTEQRGVRCEHSIGTGWTEGSLGSPSVAQATPGFPHLPTSFHAGTLAVNGAYPGLPKSTGFMLGLQQAQVESSILVIRKKREVTDSKKDSKGVWLWYPKC